MADPLLLGVEIGGTKLQLGLGAGDGRLVALRRLAVRPEAGAAGIRDQIVGAYGPMLAEAGAAREDVAAAGVGFGGPVDAARGVVTTSHQVAGWDGFPLADWIRSALGVPVVSVHNDADTAALGEARFGAGVGLSPILYVTIGSGIGGGLVIDGRIYRGAGAGAVEIGHLILDDPDDPRPATLEGLASGWALGRSGSRAVAALQERGAVGGSPLVALCGGDPSRVTGALVAEAARRGDEAARDILRGATRAMGRALAHAVTLLAPRRIILGGGVSLMGEELWFAPIRRELDRRVFLTFRGTYDVVPAALGEEVVVHGALALAGDARFARG